MNPLASDIIFAVVWLVAIAASWDAVRRSAGAAKAKADNARLDALERLNAGERLARLEQGVTTLRNTQNAPKKRQWGE